MGWAAGEHNVKMSRKILLFWGISYRILYFFLWSHQVHMLPKPFQGESNTMPLWLWENDETTADFRIQRRVRPSTFYHATDGMWLWLLEFKGEFIFNVGSAFYCNGWHHRGFSKNTLQTCKCVAFWQKSMPTPSSDQDHFTMLCSKQCIQTAFKLLYFLFVYLRQ